MPGLTPVPSGAPEGTGAPSPEQLGELLRSSSRGDQAAFARLYDATAARVHGLVLRVVRDPAQAEEVTQEAFLEIWRTAARQTRNCDVTLLSMTACQPSSDISCNAPSP